MVDNFLGAAAVAAGLLALFKCAPQVAEALIVLAVCGLLLHVFWRRNFPPKKEKKGR
jgi:membrane protein implicated in regulation of membrane protease activity